MSFTSQSPYNSTNHYYRMDTNLKTRDLSSSNGTKSNGTVDLNENTNKDLSTKRRNSHKITLKMHQVPQFVREPYIMSGYRDTDNITLHQCIATLFTVHNETFNIWSHIFAAIAIIVYSTSVFYQHGVIGNPLIYPLVCFATSVCLAFTSSWFAHLFCCMSWTVRHTCFYIDYASISVFTFTAGLGFICYSRPLDDDAFILHRHPLVFISISISLSFINMFLCCLSRHRYRKYRFFIRTGTYVFKYFFDISPFMMRCLTSSSTCDPVTVSYFKRHMLCYGISAFVNATRLPERLLPGFFDFLGYSHHIFHVLLTIGNFDAFNALMWDMRNRREELLASPFQPTFSTTIGSMIILLAVNFSIVAWFARTWLTSEERELLSGSKYAVIYRKTDEHHKTQ